MDPEEHSILAPSAAGIWGKPDGCPGYVTAAQMYPELEETQDSMDGTAAHWVGSSIIERWLETSQGPLDYAGAEAPNGVVITEEMQEAAELYANDVIGVIKSIVTEHLSWGIEKRVFAPKVHYESRGTPDAWVLDRARGISYLWDFKFGRRYVSEYENWQLINYYAGVAEALDIDSVADQHITVKMRIVQPRAYGKGGPIREWSVPASDLRGHINILHNNAQEALGPNPTYRAGPHCRYCPARGGRCEAALQGGMQLYEASTHNTPAEVTPTDVGTLLSIVERAAEQLDFIKTGLEAQAESYMRSGQNVPGRVMETTYGKLTWGKPAEEVIAMGAMLGKELEGAPAPITPKQAEKLGVDSSIIKAYCTQRTTGAKVVPCDTDDVKRIFSK